MAKNNIQRALVLQGGGSLGAYEAGVFHELYESLKDNVRDNENFFDIIAGTSIGAINAAFLVSHVIEKRKEENKNVKESWEGSAEKLEEFWKSELASNVNLSRWWPFSWDEKSWTYAWDKLSETNSDVCICNRRGCKKILFCKRIYNKWSFKCVFTSSTTKNRFQIL